MGHAVRGVGAWLWWQGGSVRWSGRLLWYCGLGMWVLLTAHVVLLTRGAPGLHPALDRTCHQPPAACCLLHNYNRTDITTCARRAAAMADHAARRLSSSAREGEHIHSPNEYLINFYHPPPGHTPPPGPATPGGSGGRRVVSWVLVGDSRVRQVFSGLVTRLSSSRLKYRKPSTGGKWRSVHELIESLRIGKLHEDIEVRHLDAPLRLSFLWDPLLQRLPQRLQSWVAGTQPRPSLLLLGSGIHWMRTTLNTAHSDGLLAALDKFKQHMQSLLPHLAQQTHLTQTILMLQDHVQESQIFKKYRIVYSNTNIDLYNSFLSTATHGTGITLWDSNIPLSDAYFAQCRHKYQNSVDMSWNCANPLHPGYIVVDKYVDMLLNDVCNFFLDLDNRYC